jgi:ParB family chromosome partitioning protein
MSDLINDSNNKKSRLGRGLGSLLGAQPGSLAGSKTLEQNSQAVTSQQNKMSSQAPAQVPSQAIQLNVNATPPEARIWKISIDKLVSGKYQPRTTFEKERLEDLSQSIKANGIVQPIVARKIAVGKYEIIAGERRWRAAQLAGLHEVPVILKEIENQNALELAIIENIQREDLNPVEEGKAYLRLIEEFHLTQQQVAEKVGKDRATIANLIRVLQLPMAVLDLVKNSLLSLGHAKVLLGLKDLTQSQKIAERIISESLSVRQAEKIIAQMNQPTNSSDEVKTTNHRESAQINSIIEDLQKRLGTKVQIDYKDGKGKVAIQFYSGEEFNNLVERLKK